MPGHARLATVVFAIALGGCLIEPPSSGDDTYYPPDDSGWGSGVGGGGGPTGYGCHADSECGSSQVCARNGDCMAATAVHVIHVNWTVADKPASDTSCTSAPKLSITFSSTGGDEFGFAPVPCNAGRYTIDKMPIRIVSVELARQYEQSGGAHGSFDATGNVQLDLPY